MREPGVIRIAAMLFAAMLASATAQTSTTASPPATSAPVTANPAGTPATPRNTARSAAEQVALDIRTRDWKRVKVPLPPVLDRSLRIAAAKADKDKADKNRADKGKADKSKADKDNPGQSAGAREPAKSAEPAPAAASAPPPVKPTGIFALFTQGNPDANSTPGDGAVVRPPAASSSFASVEGPATKVGRLGPLANPLKQRSPKETEDNSEDDDDEEDESSPNPGGIRKQISSVQTDCLQPELLEMVKKAGEHFGGEAVITSGFRSRGRRGSYHRRCAAVDFQIAGVSQGQLVAYLRKLPGAGGVGTYCHTRSVHLDTGTPRDWHQCGFHRRFAMRG